MNNDLFINSVRVISQNWELILAILTCVSWGTLLIFVILKKITGAQFSDAERIALALGAWPLPALGFSVLLLILLFFIPLYFVSVIAFALLVISTAFSIRAVWGLVSLDFVFPVAVFLFFVFIRLGFAANVVLPPYFDSALHYSIIQSLINRESIVTPLPYYHLGYHVIVAAFTWLTHANLGQVMLLFGQVILAAIPLPIYFFTRYFTKSTSSAFFGMTLAAFGWYMPAHSINWGKYPALLSLLLIQFTVGVALIKNRGLFILSAAATVLIHSRSAVLFAIFGAAWMLSSLHRNKRTVLFTLIGIILGMAILLIKQNQIIGPIFEPYETWVTLLVALLSVSVFQSFPRLMFFSIPAILLMLAGIFIPVTPMLTLLDRPLVEMTLFLPLAFLGGLGATRLPRSVAVILASVVIVHAWATYNFSPSDCCQLVNRDDAITLDWMGKNLPVNARVATASADLSMDAFGAPMSGKGTDAGTWITPLTGRTTFALSYSTDFTAQNTHDLLCEQQVTHIYAGGLRQSFDPSFADAKPAWYKIIFSLPHASIVQTLGCR